MGSESGNQQAPAVWRLSQRAPRGTHAEQVKIEVERRFCRVDIMPDAKSYRPTLTGGKILRGPPDAEESALTGIVRRTKKQ